MERGLFIHVTDTTRDSAAVDMRVDVYRLGERACKLCSARVAASGMVEDDILTSDAIERGEYEIVLQVGDYFRRRGLALPDVPLLDEVPVRIGVAQPGAPVPLPLEVSPRGFALVAPPAHRQSWTHE